MGFVYSLTAGDSPAVTVSSYEITMDSIIT